MPPRRITVEGVIHTFPEDATDADISASLGRYAGNTGTSEEPPHFSPRETTFGDVVRRRGGELASGGARGVSALVGLPRTIAELGDKAHWYLGGKIAGLLPEGGRQAFEAMRKLGETPGADLHPMLPSAEGVRARIPVPDVRSTDVIGRGLQDFGELVGSAPVRSMLGPAALGTLAAGGAREGATAAGAPPQMSEDLATVAKLGVPMGYAGVRQLRSTPGEMIARRTQTMTPQQWAAAEQAQRVGAESGVDLLGPEAMRNPAMHRLAADVRASSTGAPAIEGFLGARPGQIAAAAEGQAANLAPRSEPMEIIGRLQAAADEVVSRAVRARSSAAGPHYEAAQNTRVPDADVNLLVRQLTDAARNTAESTSRELLGLAERLRNNPTVGAISSEFKMLNQRADGAVQGVALDYGAKAAQATGGPVMRQGERSLEAISPSYARGQDIMRGPMSAEVDALTKGPIGRLATKSPDDIPNPAGAAQRQASIIVDPNVATPGNIRYIARNLSQTDPTVFRDWSAEYLRNTFNRAAKDLQSGENLMAGANWRKAIYGEPRSRDNLRTVLEEAAHAAGQPPSGVVAGFDRLMDTLQATGRIPNIGSPTATRGATMGEASQGSLGAAALNIRLADPLQPIRRWYQDIFQRRQFDELGRIFTDPQSIQLMRQLAMTGPGTAREQALLNAFANLTLRNKPEEEQQGQQGQDGRQ